CRGLLARRPSRLGCPRRSRATAARALECVAPYAGVAVDQRAATAPPSRDARCAAGGRRHRAGRSSTGSRVGLRTLPCARASGTALPLRRPRPGVDGVDGRRAHRAHTAGRDRKSTRLNSSHVKISYAVFCLKKKTQESLLFSTANSEIG